MIVHKLDDELIIERSFLREFLYFAFKNFNVFFSTRMTKDRCDIVLEKILEKDQVPKEVRTKEDCNSFTLPYSQTEFIKKAFDFDCIWVDDAPEHLELNEKFNQKVIKSDEFDGDIVDSQLKDIINILKDEIC